MLMALLMLLSLTPTRAFGDDISYLFDGGDGTVGNPYQISNKEQLEAVVYNSNHNYILLDDIAFQSRDFEAGGEYYNNGEGWLAIDNFSGVFDGNGHSISGVYTNSGERYVGIFGSVSGLIKNLTVKDSTLIAREGEEYNYVGVVAYLTGKLINCRSENNTISAVGEKTSAGGLVGLLNFGGKIIYCYNTSNVDSLCEAGGIAGSVGGNRGIIERCYNVGNINSNCAGGITGRMSGLSLTDAYNSGIITGTQYAGGVNGNAGNSNSITNFYNNGKIVSKKAGGSVCGSFVTGSINNVYTNSIVRIGNYTKEGIVVNDLSEINFPGFDFENIWEIADNKLALKKCDLPIVEHEFLKYDEVKATCTSAGNREYYVCEICDSVYAEDKTTVIDKKSIVIPALGHDLQKHDEIPATCLTSGNNSYYVCRVCNIVFKADQVSETKEKFEIIPALGHDYSTEWTIDKNASCTETGSKSHHCSRCTSRMDVTEIAATGHHYSDTVTAPTCTEQGYTTHTCTCGDSYVDSYTDALGHSFTNYVSNGDATCTKDGTKTAKCDRCDATDTVVDEGSALGCDLNGDGSTDEKDLTMLLRHVAMIKPLSEDLIARADINGDRSIDAADVTALAQYLESIT